MKSETGVSSHLLFDELPSCDLNVPLVHADGLVVVVVAVVVVASAAAAVALSCNNNSERRLFFIRIIINSTIARSSSLSSSFKSLRSTPPIASQLLLLVVVVVILKNFCFALSECYRERGGYLLHLKKIVYSYAVLETSSRAIYVRLFDVLRS